MPAVRSSGHAFRGLLTRPLRARRHCGALWAPVLALGLSLCCSAAPALAVVSANRDEMTRPEHGWVGRWNGSSAVPIAEHWFITAKHVGGLVNGSITIRGEHYVAAEIVQHPSYDLMLVRTVQPMPGWHELADADLIASGNLCVIAGYGAVAGDELADGYTWSGVRRETWGANIIESAGFLLAISFTNPASPIAVPHESIFAVNDSGGGMFVVDSDGGLRLAGVAVSVTGWGASRWGNSAYALNAAQLRNWIMPIIDPSRPVASSVQGPRAGLSRWLVGAIVLPAAFGGVVVRRRRRTAISASAE